MNGLRRCGIYTQCNTTQPFAATWMELEILILSEIKSERERQITYNIICGTENMAQMNLSTKQKQIHRRREQHLDF